MRNIVVVAIREFRQRVRSRGFLIGSLLVPIFLMVVWAFTGELNAGGGENPSPEPSTVQTSAVSYGVVDLAGLIQRIPDSLPAGLFEMFQSETDAKTALQNGGIAAYYVIPADFRESGAVTRVSEELPTSPPESNWFNELIVNNLFPDARQAQIDRLEQPFNGSSRPDFVNLAPEENASGGGFSMLPFLVTMAVMLPLFTSGSYLLQSLSQEKSSRVMEMLLVSLRPWQLLAGKMLGLGALIIVQYLIWAVLARVGLALLHQSLPSLLAGISLSAAELALALPFALGGFLLYAGIMAGIGALSPNIEGSRGWVFIISLPMMIPIYVWVSIVEAPNGPIAVALSLIPFSAPVAMLIRMTGTVVPTWQLATSLSLLLLTGVGMVWLMGRLFRVQTLLSGEALNVRRLLAALRG